MKPKDIKLYQFDDGWSIWRILDKAEKERFTGPAYGAGKGGVFGLYNSGMEPRSVVEIRRPHSDENLYRLNLSQTVMTPDYIISADNDGVSGYWMSFISEGIDEDRVGALFRSVLGFPDDLLELLGDPSIELMIQKQIQAWMDAPHVTDKDLDDANNRLYAYGNKVVSNIFSRMHDFEVGTVDGVPSFTGVKFIQNNHLLLIELGPFGWSLFSGNGEMPEMELIGEPSLLSLWRRYVQIVAEEFYVDLVPESQVESWWVEHTEPGTLLFDLTPYGLVNVDSPFTWTDSKFIAWARTMGFAE